MARSSTRFCRFVLIVLMVTPVWLVNVGSATAAQLSGSTYTSPNYGYSISWPSGLAMLSETSDSVSESLSLGDQQSFVYFVASDDPISPRGAVDSFADFVRTDQRYSSVTELPASSCQVERSSPPDALRCFQFDRAESDGVWVTEGLLIRGWDLGNGTTLLMLASAKWDSFDFYRSIFGQIVVTLHGSAAPAQPDMRPTGELAIIFEPGVSESDRLDISESARLGTRVIGSFLGPAGLDTAEIIVRAAESPSGPFTMASTLGQQIEVFTGGAAWQSAPSLIRIEAVVHELMHVYQNTLEKSVMYTAPLWFDEGTAEAVGYLAISQLGVVDQDEIYALALAMLTHFPVSGSLAALTPYGSMTADSYPLAYIAVQYLLGRSGMSVSALAQVYEAIDRGRSFADAFASIFGISVDEFYVEFDDWRSRLAQVTEFPLDFVTPPSSGLAAPATWALVPSSIERGDQLVLVVATEPGAACTIRVLVPGQPVERTAQANGDGEAFWLITIPATTPIGLLTAQASCGSSTIAQGVVVR